MLYNAVNLYLLSKLTKDKTLEKHARDAFLYRLKKFVFILSCVTIAISKLNLIGGVLRLICSDNRFLLRHPLS